MPDKHLSSQFDNELNSVSSRLMEMGGLVESQIQQAVYALSLFVENVADGVIENEHKVNTMEIEIDRELSMIIAKRQPTANDLRLLMAISKATANLERAGDEAAKIARMVKSMMTHGGFRALPSSELRLATEMASDLLRKSLDAFARLDTATAVTILKEKKAAKKAAPKKAAPRKKAAKKKAAPKKKAAKKAAPKKKAAKKKAAKKK